MMSDKPKCSLCDKHVLSRGFCSTHYGQAWKRAKESGEDIEQVIASALAATETALVPATAIEPDEVIPPERQLKSTHLVARSPVEMEAARDDLKAWLEQKLTQLEADIIEANAALNEARRNGWSTIAFTSARNRAVDDETFYNKILVAVEAGYTIIPDFPIQVFAIRQGQREQQESMTFQGALDGREGYGSRPVNTDCASAGEGEYRNPSPATHAQVRENKLATPDNKQPRYYTTVTRYSHPAAPISFPAVSARSPIMRATRAAMTGKTFDQIGVCHPTIPVGSERRVNQGAARAGDPLVIGQILRRKVGRTQKCVSFIIAWHLNLDEL